jgi:TIR domain
VADIFVSYTSSDLEWAFWIGQLSAGDDIAAWMEERHKKADHILCVVSAAYLKAPYSSWERQAAQWAAVSSRPRFALPIFVESCEAPTLLAPFKRRDLHSIGEQDARARLAAYLTPAAKPTVPARFPGVGEPAPRAPAEPFTFPGGSSGSAIVPSVVPRLRTTEGVAEDVAAEVGHIAEAGLGALQSGVSSSRVFSEEAAIPNQAQPRRAERRVPRTGLLIAAPVAIAFGFAATAYVWIREEPLPSDALSAFERHLSPQEIRQIQSTVCITDPDGSLGGVGSDTRLHIVEFFEGFLRPRREVNEFGEGLNARDVDILNRSFIETTGGKGCFGSGFKNARAVGQFTR